MSINRQFVIDRLPTETLTADCFRVVEGEIPRPRAGEVLLRTRYISLDAANRAWMMGATYRDALIAGDIMSGLGLAEVVDANGAPDLEAGDFVLTDTGWQDFAARPAVGLTPLVRREPLTHMISLYGIVGFTAWVGLHRIGRIRSGETIVVSAAAGSVGVLAVQLAKAHGCRVVGIAGGERKCDFLTRELGLDAAVDYRSPQFAARLRDACAGGIDVFFDNVGGDVFEACLMRMASHGRIVCCGAVSQYDGSVPRHGPRGVPGLLVTRRLSMTGFIVSDHEADREAAFGMLGRLVAEGKVRVLEDVIDGFEQLPAALIGLLAGENIGKRMVKIA